MSPRGLQVLLVEDDELQRAVLARLLRHLGCADVQLAADGEGALRCLAQATPDVVVSDIDMPGMDGLELLRCIGDSAAAPSVVVLSAVDSAVLPSVEAMARAYGVRLLGVLAKPVQPATLEALLRTHVPHVRAPAARPPDTSFEQLRQALDAGEFEAHFQPKVRIATREVSGFEALARWRRADGVHGPGAFVGVMEARGLIDALTQKMLADAAAFRRQLAASGSEATVSVNVSIASLGDAGTAARVASIVREAGIDPREIVLEITESVAADPQLGAVLENLTRLRMQGFGLSLDDFGTGYASLQQLARIPFTELKVDRSFVAAGDSVLLRSTLALARDLQLVSVAEGVETAEQWRLLQSLDCTCAQGWLVAPALASEEALAWAVQWRSDRGQRPGWPEAA